MLPVTQPKLCFSIPASPNDNFYSQVAMFRLALDSFGGIYKEADIILTLGADEITPLPDRWKPYFGNTIKLNWVDPQVHREYGDLAQANDRLKYDYDGYDIVVLCDADTILVKPIDDVLNKVMQSPVVMGVIAHYHPFAQLIQNNNRNISKIFDRIAPNFRGRVSQTDHGFSPRQVWVELAEQFVGKPIDFKYKYSLTPSDDPSDFVRSPFYVNYGFVVTTPKIIKTIEATYFDIRPKLASNEKLSWYAFSGQIALTLSLLAHDIPTCGLGLRYNYPNDPMADSLYPAELDDVRLIHYLRTEKFDRQSIFVNEDAFYNFLSLNLNGSDKVFQAHIGKLTNGRYPFEFRQSVIDEKVMQNNNASDVKNKLIVVLGMHRSGTSVVARALQVLGVDLGDNLMPPLAENNETGFWEDLDIVAFNTEMLGAIHSDWHYLVPIQPSDVNELHRRGYLARAVKMLKAKTSGVPEFGFKDPRTAKLLPFWKDVFAQSRMDVSYILSIRNPVSVCKSLSKRDGFYFEKSYLLWLDHVINSLVDTEGEKRLLVDYDHLIQSPEKELERIADQFQLKIDPIGLDDFKKDFLNMDLRHSVHKFDDLMEDESASPLVQEIYSELLNIILDAGKVDDAALANNAARWKEEYLKQKSALMLSDKLTQTLAERDREIAILNILAKELSDIKSFRSWEIYSQFVKVSNRLFPQGSLHGRIFSKLISILFFLPLKLIRYYQQKKDLIQIRSSNLYDEAWYLKQNPDLVKARITPIRHYLLFGGFEGRNPGPNFNSKWYLDTYPDVKVAGINPLVHYLRSGQLEGRLGMPGTSLRSRF